MSRILRFGFLGLAVAIVPLMAAESSQAADVRVRVGPVSVCAPTYVPAHGWYRGSTVFRPTYYPLHYSVRHGHRHTHRHPHWR